MDFRSYGLKLLGMQSYTIFSFRKKLKSKGAAEEDVEKIVKDFLFSHNPDIVVQAPSRINLINPLDAVEGDFWMPSVAINGKTNPLSVFLYIKKTELKSILKIYSFDNNLVFPLIFELINLSVKLELTFINR